MTTAPLVSVVVPNYNHAPYLPTRLESIFRQSLQDFELIFIDDASTDDSVAVAKSCFGRDLRVRMLSSNENSGNPFRQWNRGVEAARGRYVWIAESDDDATPEFLDELTSRLEARPDVGVAYCQSTLIDAAGATIGDNEEWTKNLDAQRWSRDFVANGRDECRRYLVLANTIPNAAAVVFRRDVFNAVGGAATDFRYAGDWMTWVRMLLRSNVAFAAGHWNRFRKHGESVTHRSMRDGRWALEGYRILRTVSDAVSIAPGRGERARDILFGKWFQSATMTDGRMAESDHRAIHDVARPLDSRLMRRAVGRVIRRRDRASLGFLRRLVRLRRSRVS